MINLPEVTLFSIDTTSDIEGTIKAIHTSMSGVKYGEIKLVTTKENIKKYKLKNLNDVYKSNYPIVTFSKEMREFDKKIKSFLRRKMYYHKEVKKNTNKGKKIIRKLFLSIKKNPERYINVSKYDKSDIARSICDFIAGMTDRYAINLYNKIK